MGGLLLPEHTVLYIYMYCIMRHDQERAMPFLLNEFRNLGFMIYE